MKRIGAILARGTSLVLLFLLAGLLFGWPFITLAGGGRAMAEYLTFGALVIISLLFLAAKGIQRRSRSREGID